MKLPLSLAALDSFPSSQGTPFTFHCCEWRVGCVLTQLAKALQWWKKSTETFESVNQLATFFL